MSRCVAMDELCLKEYEKGVKEYESCKISLITFRSVTRRRKKAATGAVWFG